MKQVRHKDGSGQHVSAETQGAAAVAERVVLRHLDTQNYLGRPLLVRARVAAGCAGFAVRSSLRFASGAPRRPLPSLRLSPIVDASTIFAVMSSGSVRLYERAADSLTQQAAWLLAVGAPNTRIIL